MGIASADCNLLAYGAVVSYDGLGVNYDSNAAVPEFRPLPDRSLVGDFRVVYKKNKEFNKFWDKGDFVKI